MTEIDSQIGLQAVAPPPSKPPKPKASKGKRILAYVAGAVWLLMTLPAIAIAAMSVMASDGGVNTAIYVFVYACFALPLATLIAAGCGVISGVTGRMRFVAIGSLLPFLALLVAFGAIVAGAGTAPTH